MRSGLVPVVGRPNVGKSTLVNALVGTKVAITSTRPQTTRNTIRGVLTDDNQEPSWQAVLIDTPGIHRPRTDLGKRLNLLVYGTLSEADCILFVIDAVQPIGPGDRMVAKRVMESGSPVVLAVNKVDIAKPHHIAAQLEEAANWNLAAYVPVSAKTGSGLTELRAEMSQRLVEGPFYFPEGWTSDQTDEHFSAEIIREKFLDKLRQELPHSLAVVVTGFETEGDLLRISADLLVERNSQRPIVLGNGGSMIRDCGTEARLELENVFGSRIHLDLVVKVESDWQSKPHVLDRLGF